MTEMCGNQQLTLTNRLVVAKEEGVGKGWIGEFGVSRCNYIQNGKNSKVLIYSTGNYTQYPAINPNGRNIKKNVCVGITESRGLQHK